MPFLKDNSNEATIQKDKSKEICNSKFEFKEYCNPKFEFTEICNSNFYSKTFLIQSFNLMRTKLIKLIHKLGCGLLFSISKKWLQIRKELFVKVPSTYTRMGWPFLQRVTTINSLRSNCNSPQVDTYHVLMYKEIHHLPPYFVQPFPHKGRSFSKQFKGKNRKNGRVGWVKIKAVVMEPESYVIINK